MDRVEQKSALEWSKMPFFILPYTSIGDATYTTYKYYRPLYVESSYEVYPYNIGTTFFVLGFGSIFGISIRNTPSSKLASILSISNISPN